MSKKNTIEDAQNLAISRRGICLSTLYVNNKTKLKWQCEFGHPWEANLKDVKNKNSWCPECAGLSPGNLSECREFAKSKGGECLSKEYISSGAKLEWMCSCGFAWESTFGHVKNSNSWCPKCGGVERKSIEFCRELAESKFGKCLSSNYKNNKTKLKWQCSEGHDWEACLNSIICGRWCSKCLDKWTKLTLQDCRDFATSKGGFCLSQEYINCSTKLQWQCKNNHTWDASFTQVKVNDTWCFECIIEEYTKECKILAEAKRGKFLSSGYKDCFTKLKWRCEFNHTWDATYSCISRGTWCPDCNIWKSQKKIKEMVENILGEKCISDRRQFGWFRNPDTKRRFQIDILFIDLKLAIEYDGQQHFRPVHFNSASLETAMTKFKQNKQRDILKNKLIGQHIKSGGEDIKHFIRISYHKIKELDENYLINRLKKAGVKW